MCNHLPKLCVWLGVFALCLFDFLWFPFSPPCCIIDASTTRGSSHRLLLCRSPLRTLPMTVSTHQLTAWPPQDSMTRASTRTARWLTLFFNPSSLMPDLLLELRFCLLNKPAWRQLSRSRSPLTTYLGQGSTVTKKWSPSNHWTRCMRAYHCNLNLRLRSHYHRLSNLFKDARQLSFITSVVIQT